MQIDQVKLEAFMHQAIREMGAAMNAALLRIGERVGLYKTDDGGRPAHLGRAGGEIRHFRTLCPRIETRRSAQPLAAFRAISTRSGP